MSLFVPQNKKVLKEKKTQMCIMSKGHTNQLKWAPTSQIWDNLGNQINKDK